MTDLNREHEAVLLITYKYFYRQVTLKEITNEINDLGLLDMTHNEFQEYGRRLVAERNAMLTFFDRPKDWHGEQPSLIPPEINEV